MGKFTGILIVTDYDGTFYSGNDKSRIENIIEVTRFKSQGGLFTFATGRDYPSLLAIEPDFENIVNAPVIMANGARLYDTDKQEYIHSSTLDLPLFLEFLDIIVKKYPDIGVRFSCEHGLVTPCINEIIEEDIKDKFMGNITLREMPVKDLLASGENVYKCVMIHDEEIIDDLRKTAEDFSKINSEICFTKTFSRGLEAVIKNASKGASSLKLKKYLYERDNLEYKLFAIGDYDNDLDMIKFADFGAAPANAIESVREAAKIHTVSCNDGAIADFIKIIEREYI